MKANDFMQRVKETRVLARASFLAESITAAYQDAGSLAKELVGRLETLMEELADVSQELFKTMQHMSIPTDWEKATPDSVVLRPITANDTSWHDYTIVEPAEALVGRFNANELPAWFWELVGIDSAKLPTGIGKVRVVLDARDIGDEGYGDCSEDEKSPETELYLHYYADRDGGYTVGGWASAVFAAGVDEIAVALVDPELRNVLLEKRCNTYGSMLT